MGGWGSGRHGRRSRRPMTVECPAIRVGECIETHPPHYSPDGPWLRVAITGDGAPYELRVRLDWTEQPTGGRRWWFSCPACDRRCGVLYVGGARFLACRLCLHLNYPSQRMGYERRMTAKMDHWFGRVGCHRDDEFHYKPAGMHWRTFNHALEQANEASHLANRSFGFSVRQRTNIAF
jgi:hypothetical protein